MHKRKKVGERVFLKYGAPALTFMVLGSVGLARFVKGRNEVADKRSGSYSEQEYEELRRQQQDQWRKQQEEPFDLEAAYEVHSPFPLLRSPKPRRMADRMHGTRA
jgi:hypothetical protein